MSLKSVDYAPGDRKRLAKCPYCGEAFSARPGRQIVMHLPCEETPTTAEVIAALEAGA